MVIKFGFKIKNIFLNEMDFLNVSK